MSWAKRFGGTLGQFSPFARSPTHGSAKVSDADFSYITADDLKKHGADGVGSRSEEQDMGPPRDTDALVLRNKKKDFVVHFPAYSIAKGELTVGQVRDHAAKKVGTSDPRRVKLLYRGKNLKDDSRACRSEGLRHDSELLLTIADITSASASDDDDDEDEFADGAEEQTADGEGRRRRNRGKKSKKKNKRVEQTQQTSGTSTPSDPSHLPPPSSQHSRAPSPKPAPTPATPMDKLQQLRNTLGTFLPQVDAFRANPPAEPAKKEFEHKRLSETILTQVLLKLDAVETEGDAEARQKRKDLVRETQGVLNDLDGMMK